MAKGLVPQRGSATPAQQGAQQQQQQIQMMSSSVQWKSPLPPAAELTALHAAFPALNAAERMLVMAEKGQAHAHSMDEKSMTLVQGTADKFHSRRMVGMVLSFIVAVLALGGAVYAAVHGAPSPAVFAIAGVGGGGMVTAAFMAWRNKPPSQLPPQGEPEAPPT